ncbi:MAG TPA: ferredoxin--NADP(+) reductase [Firmicutes bacterium]|nr:ferredoxin--NADP(+) reductase [Bacillota bacterium]
MKEEIFDLTIIGGGPVGIYGAFYAGMHGLKTKIIDALPQLGGQLAALYPEKYIYDLPGHPKIKAEDMVKLLLEQMNNYNDKIDCVTNTNVQTVEKLDDGSFKICTDHACHYSKSVIITAGNGAFTPRKLGVENEDQFENIHYFVPNMNHFKGKNVVIFGGGDSAVDWALMLEGVAKNVSIIHRRTEFRAHSGSVDKLQQSKINILTPHVIKSLQGDEANVTNIVIENVETKAETLIEADEVIVLFGFISSLGPIKNWDIKLDKNALRVNHRQQTSVSGIFAAGDACTFDGKIKMITTGLGEMVVAINAAAQYAYPDEKRSHKHSSTLVK